jgi:hypothetical protein
MLSYVDDGTFIADQQDTRDFSQVEQIHYDWVLINEMLCE